MESSRDVLIAQIIVDAGIHSGFRVSAKQVNDDLPIWSKQLQAVPTEMLADCATDALELLQPGKPLTPAHVKYQYSTFMATQRAVRVLPARADHKRCYLCDDYGWQPVLVYCPTRNLWHQWARGCRCEIAPHAYRREFALEPPGYEKSGTGVWQPAKGRAGLRCGCLFCGDQQIDRAKVESVQQQHYEQAKANFGGDESDGYSNYATNVTGNTADDMPF